MVVSRTSANTRIAVFCIIFTLTTLLAGQAAAADRGYKALEGVDHLQVVFDVTIGSALVAPIIFEAVKETYTVDSVKGLITPADVAVVFHDASVGLITKDRAGFTPDEVSALDKFTALLREMKKAGVTLEVCGYALRVMGVDPSEVIPEIEVVGNGFISVMGYQAQGYSLIRIPSE